MSTNLAQNRKDEVFVHGDTQSSGVNWLPSRLPKLGIHNFRLGSGHHRRVGLIILNLYVLLNSTR
ncbi:uncharacterized protein BDR25DRAFT_355925 [Lindgomyces ingoldianus]|uniref:Uncharacterized protein n=1 Tax=Lindgomyces ingoldianus TaxID=673940 RepID=A0ACB6QUP4_9PLEO|nr:uncharacterized protein BDR25DRAFT_355925 [Lindgomyces ingoldianus]KAF2470230.1 hypothetical protein BDR25DRAFT_355925 [Lindgomyces ingoldianus]